MQEISCHPKQCNRMHESDRESVWYNVRAIMVHANCRWIVFLMCVVMYMTLTLDVYSKEFYYTIAADNTVIPYDNSVGYTLHDGTIENNLAESVPSYESALGSRSKQGQLKRLSMTYEWNTDWVQHERIKNIRNQMTLEYNEIKNKMVSPDRIFITIANAAMSVSHYRVQLLEGTHTLHWYVPVVNGVTQIRVSIADSIVNAHTLDYVIHVTDAIPEVVYNTPVITASIHDILQWDATDALCSHIHSGELLDTSCIQNEDVALFRWQQFPEVLIMAFASRDVQSKYLKRFAFFAEKSGTRGTIPTLQSISHRSGWGAHYYRVEDIVRFYVMLDEHNANAANNKTTIKNITSKKTDSAQSTPILLTMHEQWLRNLFTSFGMLDHDDLDDTKNHTHERGVGNNSDDADGYIDTTQNHTVSNILPIPRVVVSFARSDSPSLQKILLYHELYHALYFIDPTLREAMRIYWNAFTETERELWYAFLTYNGYDANYQYLVINELFAYMMQLTYCRSLVVHSCTYTT